MAKNFKFRRSQIIGATAAEADEQYLSQCFIDTGDIDIIRDCYDPISILAGRTGSGKSALIRQLPEYEDHVIEIDPESLALVHIANSNILKFFTDSGVKLDIFYRLLWRHVFCVEILKEHFHITTEERKKSFLDSMRRFTLKNKKYEKALEYLQNWGESFWMDTEYRIKEVTTKLERDLQATVEGRIPNVAVLNANTARTLTEEQKAEIIHHAQQVVNNVQIRQLSEVMELMNEMLITNDQQKYFITIDKLDEDWVEDQLRFRLIRALIETSADFFARIENVKIIIALRLDLIDHVFRYTRDAGFQEEKFRTSCLNITWTKQQLIEVLDTRINLLVKNQYTNEPVTHKDLLPDKIGKITAIEYLIERTLMRPRDLIQFFNACIYQSDSKTEISKNAILEAEGRYSRERLRALFDEWFGLYPNLEHYYQVLRGKGSVFIVESLTENDLVGNYLQLLISNNGKPGMDFEMIKAASENNIEFDEFRKNIVHIFYKVGLVGLKIEKEAAISWSHISGSSVSISEINETTRMYIQKTFYRVLGINDGLHDHE